MPAFAVEEHCLTWVAADIDGTPECKDGKQRESTVVEKKHHQWSHVANQLTELVVYVFERITGLAHTIQWVQLSTMRQACNEPEPAPGRRGEGGSNTLSSKLGSGWGGSS